MALTRQHRILATKRTEPAKKLVQRQLATLSVRELEILRLAAEGESNADIGKRLVLSEGTVKNRMTHILRKLDLGNRTQAALLAVKYRLTGHVGDLTLDDHTLADAQRRRGRVRKLPGAARF